MSTKCCGEEDSEERTGTVATSTSSVDEVEEKLSSLCLKGRYIKVIPCSHVVVGIGLLLLGLRMPINQTELR